MPDLDSMSVRPLGAEELVAETGGSPIGYYAGYACRFLFDCLPEPGEAGYARGKF